MTSIERCADNAAVRGLGRLAVAAPSEVAPREAEPREAPCDVAAGGEVPRKPGPLETRELGDRERLLPELRVFRSLREAESACAAARPSQKATIAELPASAAQSRGVRPSRSRSAALSPCRKSTCAALDDDA